MANKEIRTLETLEEKEQRLREMSLQRLSERLTTLSISEVQKKLCFRSKITQQMREAAYAAGLIEVQFPIVESPWGEYYKKDKEQFWLMDTKDPRFAYALRQSPQILKQAFTYATGLNNFRVCENYRAGDCSKTHALAFYQFDVELASASGKEAMEICEKIFRAAFNKIKGPFPVRDYQTMVELYGTDTPDFHNGLEMDYLANNKIPLIHISSLKLKAKLQQYELYKAVPNVSKAGQQQFCLKTKTEISPEDLILLFPHWEIEKVRRFRKEMVNQGLSEKISGGFRAFWVINLPFASIKRGKLVACHHPMSLPLTPVDWENCDPTKVLCDSYDLLFSNANNTIEIAGGDARIYQEEQQRKALQALGYTEAEINKKYAFLLQTLKFNDEHKQIKTAGFAFGIERLLVILTESDNLSQVCAFPQNEEGPLFTVAAPVITPPRSRK